MGKEIGMTAAQTPSESGYPTPGKLEMIWGEGFVSPGGPDEVLRIMADHDIRGCSFLDVGFELMRWMPPSSWFQQNHFGTFDAVGWALPPHQFSFCSMPMAASP
jgi:hypothetical protein